MNRNLAPGLAIGKSKIEGRGCFATIRFRQGSQVAEYTGERISLQEAWRRMRRGGKIRICRTDTDCCIDGSVGGNGTEYINHSCEPNCYALTANARVLVFALRDILPGEEITVDYVSSYHSDRKMCRCHSAHCRGTINHRRKAAE